jgi:hypothetical protein
MRSIGSHDSGGISDSFGALRVLLVIAGHTGLFLGAMTLKL